MNTKIWTTKDGREIPIKDMEDSHLLSTIKMLDRAHLARIWECCRAQSFFQGDMAIFSMEQEESRMANLGPSYNWPIYADLVEEAEDRGLMEPREMGVI